MIFVSEKTLQRKIDLAVANRVTVFKADIKELKKQVGYWVIDNPDMANMFAVFTSHRPAKPEFSVTEKIQAILDHLKLEVEKIESEEKIVCKRKVKPEFKQKPIVYKKRGIVMGEKK